MKPQFYALLLPEFPASGSVLRQITLQSILGSLLIIAAAILAIRYIARLAEAWSNRSPGSRFVLKWTEQVVRLVISFVTIFTVLLILAPNSDTFLAALGSAAIAIALGAQDLIKNFVGGLVILTDRPYQLGDRVTIGDSVGEVMHIGLRSTKLRTPDDSWVTVSNADLLNGQVINDNYGVPECQVVTTLYVPTDIDPKMLLQLGREAALCSPYLRSQRPVTVLLSDEYSETPFMKIRIKAYVCDHRYVLRMQTDITARMKMQFARAGVLDKWKAE